MSNHAWIEENKCIRDCGPYCVWSAEEVCGAGRKMRSEESVTGLDDHGNGGRC